MSELKKLSPHTLFSTYNDSSQHFRLFMDDIIHDGAQIHELLNALHNAGDEDTLEIRINSGGGFVRYGQQLINVIKGRFPDRCLTIIEADACSMAALVFMAGYKRIVYEHSTLMVHDLAMYLDGKASESKKQLEAETYVFKNRFKALFLGTLELEEIDDIFDGKDMWFSAEEMCKRGMATHVMMFNGETIEADEFLERLNNPREQIIRNLKDDIYKYRNILSGLEKSSEEYEDKLNDAEALLSKLEKPSENSDSGQAAE